MIYFLIGVAGSITAHVFGFWDLGIAILVLGTFGAFCSGLARHS